MADLSIIVPSFNRPAKLLATVQALYPQIGESTSIVVLDNCSDQNYASYCTRQDPSLLALVNEGRVKFIRHPANLGMSANFMRAFEICDTEWMWLICDDDTISPNAVRTIQSQIAFLKENEDVALVKFSSRGCEAKAGGEYIRRLVEIIDRLSLSTVHFNSFIFLSNNVYRFPHFRGQIGTGYLHLHTHVPHLMMALHYLAANEGKEAIFLSDCKIATYVKPEIGYSYGFVAGLGVGAFKNFPFNIASQDYRRLENVFAAHNDYKVAIDLFYFARKNAKMHVARRLVHNYYVQIRTARSLVQRVLFRSFTLLLWTPALLERLIALLPFFSSQLGPHIAEIKQRAVKPTS